MKRLQTELTWVRAGISWAVWRNLMLVHCWQSHAGKMVNDAFRNHYNQTININLVVCMCVVSYPRRATVSIADSVVVLTLCKCSSSAWILWVFMGFRQAWRRLAQLTVYRSFEGVYWSFTSGLQFWLLCVSVLGSHKLYSYQYFKHKHYKRNKIAVGLSVHARQVPFTSNCFSSCRSVPFF